MSTKPVIESNRCIQFPCELTRKYSRKTRERNMITLESLHSLKCGIVGNCIKHIVLPLYLLFLYIFVSILLNFVENIETEYMNSNNDYYEKKGKKMKMKTEDRRNETSADRFLGKLQNFESTFKDNSGKISSSDDFNENSEDEMKTAGEDFDSSTEEWSDANNATTMNMSLDHENDIFHITGERCISTKDKDFSSFPKFPKQREESKQNNFFCDKGNDNFFNDFSNTSRLNQNEIRGLKRRILTEFTADTKKQKIVFDKEKTESHIEHKNESKMREKKRNFSQNGSIKYKSHFSRTLNKKLKWKNIECTKITETDSSLSTDDDVKISPIQAKRSERTINFTICQFQDQNVHGELNYMAKNEGSIDGFLQITHERISLFKTSFSSINSGFEKRASETRNMNIIAKQWSMILPDRINSSRSRCSRAPPGFPELPQNPPLMSYIFDPQFILSSSNDNNDPNFFHLKSMAIVPPAPPPMRHLYYEYPEFMDLPIYVNSSRTLNDIYNM